MGKDERIENSPFKKYNDLKFGMFIHWGVYSQLGGTWQGVKIVPETHGAQATLGEWIMSSAKSHGRHTERLQKSLTRLDLMQNNGLAWRRKQA